MQSHQVQVDSPQFLTIVASFLGSLAVFWLGTFATALKNTAESESRTRAYYDKRVWANMIIVYVTVCFPITWSATSAYSQTSDSNFLVFNIVALFVAGLELEFHARSR